MSHRISALEEDPASLFQRFHRKVALTADGQRVFWALKSSLEFINQEILEIRHQELSGTLTVYSRPPSPSAGWCRDWRISPAYIPRSSSTS